MAMTPMEFHEDHLASENLVYHCSVVAGSIARNAKRRYLSYSEADFEVFRPAGATRCTDGVKFVTEEKTEGPLLRAKPPCQT